MQFAAVYYFIAGRAFISGIAEKQWKPRGGGKPALMIIDKNDSMRIWAKMARASSPLLQPSPSVSHVEDFERLPASPNIPAESFSSYSMPM
jgi:hypothetical protein